MIRVLSSSPCWRRNSSSRPTWWSVWDRNPAKTSIIRRTAAAPPADSDSQSGTSGSCRDSSRVRRDDAEFLLPGEHLLAVGVPAVVEHARVPVGPLLRHVVRGVRGAEAEVQVERLVRVDLLGVGDELDRLVDQVLAQVVALLRRPRRLDLVVVVHQVRIPLAGVTAEEAVEALEAAPQRPPVVRARGRLLVARRQVPLPDHERAVAVLEQHLGQEAVLERHDPVVPGITGRELGDARPSRCCDGCGRSGCTTGCGEHNAVVCMLLYRRPSAASASKFGVSIGLP